MNLWRLVLQEKLMKHFILGKEDEKPEFSDGTYFTMLFSCGIAIGLFYYGVAEPIYHYQPGAWKNRYWGR